MNRLVSAPYREAIAEALATIPPAIADRLRFVDFLTDTDPLWAGLEDDCDIGDGRILAETGHCSYPWHTHDRTTTIVLPTAERGRIALDAGLIVHELGHALDFWLGFSHLAAPVSDYARTDRQEAFAESFRAWLYWHGDQDALAADVATLALFAKLAG